MSTFRALVLHEEGGKVVPRLETLSEEALPPGEVTVDVEYSTLNYKDAMILEGIGRLVRRYPHVPGIDFAGTVEQSSHPQWKAGDRVICNGWGMGETHLGAYAEKARVKGDWLVRLPDGISTRDAMAIDLTQFNVDSDAAYQTGAGLAGDWLKKNPGKELASLEVGETYRFQGPVWYLQWGDKKAGYSALIDANSGKNLNRK